MALGSLYAFDSDLYFTKKIIAHMLFLFLVPIFKLIVARYDYSLVPKVSYSGNTALTCMQLGEIVA